VNKRARLARRILREHRAGTVFHYTKIMKLGRASIYGYWYCTHCRGVSRMIPKEIPRAYR
jgi:hypothetical protein